jgi:hypothetical protein
VSGQEDPHTGRRGHTVHLNIAERARDVERYFPYHELFERLRVGGSVNGYAHVGSDWFGESVGLALDVPFGIVDVVEVLQAYRLRIQPWYDFLNLGFRLTPITGSDYPYVDPAGAVRLFAGIDGPLTRRMVRCDPGWPNLRLERGRCFRFTLAGPQWAGLRRSSPASPYCCMRRSTSTPTSMSWSVWSWSCTVRSLPSSMVPAASRSSIGLARRRAVGSLLGRSALTGCRPLGAGVGEGWRREAHVARAIGSPSSTTWKPQLRDLVESTPDPFLEDFEIWDSEASYLPRWLGGAARAPDPS